MNGDPAPESSRTETSAPPAPASEVAWGSLRVLARGATEALLVRGVGAVAGFAAHWALAQALPMDAYGAYLHVLGWIGLLALPCTLGFHLGVVRLVSAFDAANEPNLLRGVLPHAARVTLLSAAAVALPVAAASWAFDLGAHYTAIAVTAGALLLPAASLTTVAAAAATGLRRIVAARAPSSVLRPILIGGAAFGLARTAIALDAQDALAIALVAYVVTLGVTWALARGALRRSVGPGPAEVDAPAWNRIAFPLLGYTGLEMLIGGMAIPLIALILGEIETAAFGVALRIAGILKFPILSANAIVGPVIAGAHARGELAERSGAIRVIARVVSGLALVGALAVGGFAEPLLQLFGSEYTAGTAAVRLLALSAVVVTVLGPHDLLLAMTGATRPLIGVMGFSTALQLVGLVLVLEPYGITGAALVCCAVEIVRSALALLVVRHRFGTQISVFSWKGR